MPTALLLPLIQLIMQALPYVPKLVDDLKQSGELTPDQEKSLDDSIEAHKNDPYWKVNDV